jgi:benzoyl-CoA-dihydrodiol lyase
MLSANAAARRGLREDSMIDFQTSPERYRHWKLSCDGPVATLALDVAEDGGIAEGYKLKLNSYDLGVDIELHDAVQRIRFEHPEVRVVVITSAKERERVFCAGANIYMLASATHAAKVNFCKFTNETRNGFEDSSAQSGLKFIAALNGTTAGGGYELALACDEIVMIDDRSSTVALPEVPLLGVLPGTGGLTRLVDKRRVRRDLADAFCTTADGVRADRAKAWGLVDHIVKPAEFKQFVQQRAAALASHGEGRGSGPGVALKPLERTIDERGYRYSTLDVALDAAARVARLTVRAPERAPAAEIDAILAEGCAWWPLRFARELDDAILGLRANHGAIGTLVIQTQGEAALVRTAGDALLRHRRHWFGRETLSMLRRTLRRFDASSRSLFALAGRGSTFAGLSLELALAADRLYMLDVDGADAPALIVDEINFHLPMSNGLTRLAAHFSADEAAVIQVRKHLGERLDTKAAQALGLVTFAPDELDWADETRLAVEERAALSPDALTGMEASLRFAGPETLETKVYGRLSAWQNWVFNRPNAVGPKGALKLFGSGSRAAFDWERV